MSGSNSFAPQGTDPQDGQGAAGAAGPSAGLRTPIDVYIVGLLYVILALFMMGLGVLVACGIARGRPEPAYVFFGAIAVETRAEHATDMIIAASLYCLAGVTLLCRQRLGWVLALVLAVERVPNILATGGIEEAGAWGFALLSVPVVLWLLARWRLYWVRVK